MHSPGDHISSPLYRMGFPEIRLFRIFRRRQAGPPLALHKHAEDLIEFVFVAQGRQTYEINGNVCELEAGDVMVIRPGEFHSSGSFPEERGVFFWLGLTMPKTGEGYLGLPKHDAALLMDEFQRLQARSFRAAARTQSYFEAVFSDLSVPSISISEVVRIRGNILLLIGDLLVAAARHDLPGTQPWRRAVSALMDARVRDPVNVAELAKALRMSPQLFSMKFKQHVHATPSEYLMRRKIELAKQELRRQPDLSITRIAMDLGFVSSQHFATAFKRITSMTPGQYRRQVCIEALMKGSGAGPDHAPEMEN